MKALDGKVYDILYIGTGECRYICRLGIVRGFVREPTNDRQFLFRRRPGNEGPQHEKPGVEERLQSGDRQRRPSPPIRYV